VTNIATICSIPITVNLLFIALPYKTISQQQHYYHHSNHHHHHHFSIQFNNISLWLLLIIINTIKIFLSFLSFTAINMQVNNSAPIQFIGTVNGLSQSFGSMARGLGTVTLLFYYIEFDRFFNIYCFIIIIIIIKSSSSSSSLS
jgi:hypothetical protein